MCLPWKEKLKPRSEYALKFSLPGVIALALHHLSTEGTRFTGNKASIDRLDELADLMDKISYQVSLDESGTPVLQGAAGAVTVTLIDGRRISLGGSKRRGSGFLGTSMSAKEISRKFVENVAYQEDSLVPSSEDIEWAPVQWAETIRSVTRDPRRIDLSGATLLALRGGMHG
jgi:2-methylcitrate dehydratase PrpD